MEKGKHLKVGYEMACCVGVLMGMCRVPFDFSE